MAGNRVPMSDASPRKIYAMGDTPVQRKNGGKIAKPPMVRDMDRDGMKKGGKVKMKKGGKC